MSTARQLPSSSASPVSIARQHSNSIMAMSSVRCVAQRLVARTGLLAPTRGAARAAIINTVIETAIRLGVEVWAYLHDVLVKLSAGWPMRRLAELLPENWSEPH